MKKQFSFLHKSFFQSKKYPPLKNHSISRELEITTNLFPDKIALTSYHQDIEFTWQQIFNKSSTIAANLLDMGLKKGDKVGMFSSNHYEWYLTQFACSLADLVFVTINPAYQKRELQYCLKKTDISAIISSNYQKPKKFMDTLEQNFKDFDIKSPYNLNLKEYPYLKQIIIADTEQNGMKNSNWFITFKEELLDKEPTNKSKNQVKNNIINQDPYSPTNIQFTSGTTGNPKGVVLTHHNLLNNSNLFADILQYDTQDKICLPVPLYHCFGMVLGNLASLNKGCQIIFSSPTFNAQKAIEACEKYKATSIYGVPTMFIEYLKEINKKKYNIENLNKGVMAGSLCPEILLQQVKDKMNVKQISVAYGMTETSPISFLIKPYDSDLRKTQTVGSLTPHLQMKILNDQNEITNINEEGELVVKGYSVMQGYYNDQQATNQALQNGWMRTGDLCCLDQYGYLKVTGREKDLIIRGGENISPKEIEDCILKIKEVENVQVIGVDDEKFGEEICALVKLFDNQNLTKEDIKKQLKGQLSHFKIPKYIRFVDSLPITVTGKPQKYKMRQEWKEHIQNVDPSKYQIR